MGLFANNNPSTNVLKPTTDQQAIDDAQKLVDGVADATVRANMQVAIEQAKGLLTLKNTPLDYSLLANGADITSTAITGTIGKGITSVSLLIDGDVKATGTVNSDGTYSIPTNDFITQGSKVEVAGYNGTTEVARKTVKVSNNEKPLAPGANEALAKTMAANAVLALFQDDKSSTNKLKTTTAQKTIDFAQNMINVVLDPVVKAALQAELDKAQQLLNNSVLAIPQLNPMTEADTVFSGQLDVSKYNPGTIRIYINNAPATVVTVDASGNFSFNIGNRQAGDVIGVDYKDRTGQYNTTTKTSITVTPVASNLTINKMTENDDTITGKTAPNAKVRYVVSGQAVNVGNADANGNYSMYIGKQKTGTVVGVEVFDPATNKYKATVTTTVLAVNVTIQSMTNTNDTVSGTAPASAKLRFLINGTAVNVGTADASGNYSKYVGTQIVGTTVAVEILNPDTGKYELAKTTTVTGAPKSVNYTVGALTTEDDTLSGTAPANAKLRFSINGNLISVITADASGNYSKYIGKQKVGTVVSVELLNENTNQYTAPQAVTVTVGTGNATLAPVIHTITEGQGVVTGTVPASITTVRVWVNGVAQVMVPAANGNFTWTKANLKADDTVKVDYKDATGTWISAEKIVTK
ncbi:hypothetical protein HCA69_13275 [Listeria grandensis]|uniref:Bacterial Ig domain-containing protein n=1 Tax=Listeria grandensis TaxID=1494963 RepID=A0A7X0Y5S0_9LIST|nr:hypothetical protein [Listeria grandensis]